MIDLEMSPFATLAIDSHIAIVTLNRPAKHNAMNLAMREELHAKGWKAFLERRAPDWRNE